MRIQNSTYLSRSAYSTTENTDAVDYDIKEEINKYRKDLYLQGISLNGDYSSLIFYSNLEKQMQQARVPNNSELQSARIFLKNQAQEIMQILYKKNANQIDVAIATEKNILAQKGSNEDLDILKNQGGDKILNLLKTFPIESKWAENELQSAIANGDLEQVRMGLQNYIQNELASIGTEFFAFALNFEDLEIPEDTKTKIIESLSLIHSFYHKSTSINVNGVTINYASGGIRENASMGFLVAKINGVEISQNATNIIAYLQESRHEELFNIFKNRENLEKVTPNTQENTSDSIMQTLLKDSRNLKTKE